MQNQNLHKKFVIVNDLDPVSEEEEMISSIERQKKRRCQNGEKGQKEKM